MSGGRGFDLQSAKFMQVENTRAETLAWSPPGSDTRCVRRAASAIFDPVHVLRDAREGDSALRLMYLWKVRVHRHCKGDYNTISGPPPATQPRLYDLQCSCDQPWSFLHPATSFKDIPEYKIIFKQVGTQSPDVTKQQCWRGGKKSLNKCLERGQSLISPRLLLLFVL